VISRVYKYTGKPPVQYTERKVRRMLRKPKKIMLLISPKVTKFDEKSKVILAMSLS